MNFTDSYVKFHWLTSDILYGFDLMTHLALNQIESRKSIIINKYVFNKSNYLKADEERHGYSRSRITALKGGIDILSKTKNWFNVTIWNFPISCILNSKLLTFQSEIFLFWKAFDFKLYVMNTLLIHLSLIKLLRVI